MPVPSLDGNYLFGVAISMQVVDNPRGSQTNAYPGVNGLEELDQGQRGRFLVVTGRLKGAGYAALNGAEGLIRSYNDGLAHVLVDQFGNAWTNAKLESFEPQGQVQNANDLDGTGPCFHRRYTARFKILN